MAAALFSARGQEANASARNANSALPSGYGVKSESAREERKAGLECSGVK